jgi:NIPSNAP protein
LIEQHRYIPSQPSQRPIARRIKPVIYQLRIFTDHPGRVDAHINRFREHTCRLLEKHGITVVGCFTTANEEHRDQVVFITAHESLEAMQAAQRAFAADPEQNAMVKESEKDGPIIEHSDNWYLKPADFSPLK